MALSDAEPVMPDVPPSDPPSLIDQFLETSYDVFNDVSDTLYGDVFETPDYIVPPAMRR